MPSVHHRPHNPTPKGGKPRGLCTQHSPCRSCRAEPPQKVPSFCSSQGGGSNQWDVGSTPRSPQPPPPPRPPPLVPMEGVGPGGTLVFGAEIRSGAGWIWVRAGASGAAEGGVVVGGGMVVTGLWSFHSSVHPSVHLSIRPSICMCIHLSVHPVCPSVRPSIPPTVLSSADPSILPFLHPSSHPTIPPRAIFPSIHHFFPVHPSLCPLNSPTIHSC